MKRIGYFLLAAILFTILVGGVNCQSKSQYTTATPEGTIRLFFDAYSSLDADKMVNLYVEEEREKIKPNTVAFLGRLQSIRFVALEIKTVSQIEYAEPVSVSGRIEDSAMVKASFKGVYSEKDGSPRHFPYQTVKFHLEKREGKWLILQPPPAV